ncbi:unnamed protein product [Protopolystoma xenopodis]|uniref:Uncharacterized protein n=1 Tax=Protopolystoma xenopodis TaxID=117903 RepID=A0A448WEJ0_9PLAT|nr:unnamed protein product [Protopolystoma xenopodis]
MGWGLKSSGPAGFSPELIPQLFPEYPESGHVQEAMDPSPEDEAAVRASHLVEGGEEEEQMSENDPGDEDSEAE